MEVTLCKHKNITLVVVDGFDIYEKTEQKCTDCGVFIKIQLTSKSKLMKLDFKISNDCLQALEGIFKNIRFNPTSPQHVRVCVSILETMADKIITKAHKGQQLSMFDAKKKHKLSLKYYEAFAIHEIIGPLNEQINKDNQHQYTLISNFIHSINQKLC